jgi:hypothetical protein
MILPQARRAKFGGSDLKQKSKNYQDYAIILWTLHEAVNIVSLFVDKDPMSWLLRVKSRKDKTALNKPIDKKLQ